jgi:hypothetical protein
MAPEKISAAWFAVGITIIINIVGIIVYFSGLGYRLSAVESLKEDNKQLQSRVTELEYAAKFLKYRLDELEKKP